MHNKTISKKKKYPSIKKSNSSLSYSNLKITKMQICTWLLVQFKIQNYSVLGELFDPQKVQSQTKLLMKDELAA